MFNPAGTAQAWIYTQDGYDPNSNTRTIPAFLETGGTFPPHFDASKRSVRPFGTLMLPFTACGAGTLDLIARAAASRRATATCRSRSRS